LQRPEKAEPYRQQILELFSRCQGNLVRVHEELLAGGAALSYAALTAFCRRHGIGYAPPTPAGQYAFAPGVELQHDTSPHELELGGKTTLLLRQEHSGRARRPCAISNPGSLRSGTEGIAASLACAADLRCRRPHRPVRWIPTPVSFGKGLPAAPPVH
jgi:hypothetical protein